MNIPTEIDTEASEREKRRYDEYLICQQRGHSESPYQTMGMYPKHMCRFCGTLYWEETITREAGAPVGVDV
jgi:hypothetical protein